MLRDQPGLHSQNGLEVEFFRSSFPNDSAGSDW